MNSKELMRECVGAHEFCGSMTSCPLCEPVYPLRYEDGKFAPNPVHDEFIPLRPPILFISPKLKEEIDRVLGRKE